MFGKKETATLENNGKRGRQVFLVQAKADLKAFLQSLVDSNLNAEELLEVFANTGIQIPVLIVSNILAARYAKYVEGGEDAAIKRGEAARKSGKAPDSRVYNNVKENPSQF